jgi:hypothetical protein
MTESPPELPTAPPRPVFRTSEKVLLIGTMAIYGSQAEASQLIPRQWREFRQTHPALGSTAKFYGASPCAGDRKIHYLTGVDQASLASPVGESSLGKSLIAQSRMDTDPANFLEGRQLLDGRRAAKILVTSSPLVIGVHRRRIGPKGR